MKNLFFAILMFVVCAPSVCAQVADDIYGDIDATKTEKETKAEQKAREKQLKTLNDSVAYNRALHGIEQKYFVVQVERIAVGTMGYPVNGISNSTNFVLQQGDHAWIQLVYNSYVIGDNGLGGITVDGSVSREKIKTKKNGDTVYSFVVSGASVHATVSITIFAGTNQVVATVDPTFANSNNRVTMYGTLVPYIHKNH